MLTGDHTHFGHRYGKSLGGVLIVTPARSSSRGDRGLILPRLNPGTVEFYHRRIAEAPQVLFATIVKTSLGRFSALISGAGDTRPEWRAVLGFLYRGKNFGAGDPARRNSPPWGETAGYVEIESRRENVGVPEPPVTRPSALALHAIDCRQRANGAEVPEGV